MTWETLGEWWLGEVQDPAYEQVVTPLLLEVLVGIDGGGLVADLGCGDGRVMGRVEEVFGATVVGVELVEDLARRSGRPVVVGRLPDIPLADGSVDGAYAVLVLEHLDDHESFFAEAARVVRRGGFLAIVSNHPTGPLPVPHRSVTPTVRSSGAPATTSTGSTRSKPLGTRKWSSITAASRGC